MATVVRELEFNPTALQQALPDTEEAVFKNVNYLQLLLKYRWWVLMGCLAGVMAGGLLYVRSGPEYEATAQILVSRKDSVPIREEMRMLSDFGERSEHIALILSPLIINRAIEIGHLENLPAFRGEKLEDISQDIIDSLKVKRSSGQDRSYMNVLTITYPSRRADDAQAVVQAVITAYNNYLEQTRQEKSSEVLQVTQQALTEVETKLRAKEQEYHAFRDASPMQWKAPVGANSADGQQTTNVHQERVLAAEEQRRSLLIRKATLESRLKTIEAAMAKQEPRETLELLIRRFVSQDGPSGGEFQQQQQQDINIFDNRLLPMILEEQQLLRDFGADHPEVIRVRKSLATALDFYRRQGIRLPEERLQQAGKGGDPTLVDYVALYLSSLKQEQAELLIRDRELAQLVDDESTKAKSVARLQAKDEALHAELTRLRELWGQLITQVNQVGIERDGNGYVLKQITPVKHELSMKRIMKFVGGGGVMGCLLFAGLCLLRELRDLRFKSVQELRLAFNQPIIGTVGHFTTTVDPTMSRSRIHAALRYLLSPRSAEAESFRSLRTALGVMGDDGPLDVLQVTSPESGDGKTTTIANLAVAMAQSGRRVLLIDADLRRPMVHQLFQTPNEIGLTDVLQGEIDGLTATRDSHVESLRILTAGHPPANPAELLASPRFAELLRTARSEFDLVLIDTPPLLAVSDAAAIARHSDGLLMVVRLNKTNLNIARRANEVLSMHGLKLLGLVANDVAADDRTAYSGDDAYYRDIELVAPQKGDTAELTTMPAGQTVLR